MEGFDFVVRHHVRSMAHVDSGENELKVSTIGETL